MEIKYLNKKKTKILIQDSPISVELYQKEFMEIYNPDHSTDLYDYIKDHLYYTWNEKEKIFVIEKKCIDNLSNRIKYLYNANHNDFSMTKYDGEIQKVEGIKIKLLVRIKLYSKREPFKNISKNFKTISEIRNLEIDNILEKI